MTQPPPDYSEIVSDFAREVGGLGVQIVDVAEQIEEVASRLTDQTALMEAAQRGIGVCNAAPYGGGILVKGPSADPRYQYHPAPDELLQAARRMEELCFVYGYPLGALALQVSLSDPRITSTIVGVGRPGRVAQTLSFAQMSVPEPLRADIEAISATRGQRASR